MVNMKLPICKGTYSSDEDVDEVAFLCDFTKFIKRYMGKNKEYFAGLCHNCYYQGSSKRHITPCSGCQLVGYCSKACQKEDWGMHHHVCKEFPVVQQMNVLQIKGPWKEKIANLRERAAKVPHAAITAKSIFQNPRVCRNCHDASPSRLTICKCLCVTYCSISCSMRDHSHSKDCASLGIIAQTCQLIYDHHIQSLRNMSVCRKFTPMSKFDDIFPGDYQFSIMKDLYIREDEEALAKYSSLNERLSYPMSLLYALTMLPGRLLGRYFCALEDLTNLVVHVVISSPLFDSEPWEEFMHRLPKLKELHVVFIIQGKAFKHSLHNNIRLTLQRCRDCQAKNRIITYSVHQMKYHMFFSSETYTEPDVVVVYGNTHEMPASVEDDVHSEISYGNMTSGSHTVLVITDATKHRVVQGVSAVYFASSVETLVSPQINPLRGFSSNRNDIDSDENIYNDKYYFACLRKKDEKRSGRMNSYQYKLFKHWLKQWLVGKIKACLHKCDIRSPLRRLIRRIKDYLLYEFDRRWLLMGVACLLWYLDLSWVIFAYIFAYLLVYLFKAVVSEFRTRETKGTITIIVTHR